ncbi:hypothetical protein BX666DRAFT_873742 [Dichotomocladium elegans]|nr:hypothetical protein BX666DRAFT_873742 [Dichotomocladium elegans]
MNLKSSLVWMGQNCCVFLTHLPTLLNRAAMPVPFEALIPFGIIAGMFAVTGTGMTVIRYYSNDRKPTRFGLDNWEKQMMERDRRLTGSVRGQSTNPIAPPEFATNSVWYLEKPRAA